MAMEWQRQLDASEVATQAEIARQEGITRARVTQIMALLRLPPEIRERVLSLPETTHRLPITERALRPMVQLKDSEAQLRAFTSLWRLRSD